MPDQPVGQSEDRDDLADWREAYARLYEIACQRYCPHCDLGRVSEECLCGFPGPENALEVWRDAWKKESQT